MITGALVMGKSFNEAVYSILVLIEPYRSIVHALRCHSELSLLTDLQYRLTTFLIKGTYALYPNNDVTQTARKGAGGGMLFVICIFVLAYGCSWGPGGWVNSE